MRNTSLLLPLIELNIATLILGSSGPLGRIIALPPPFTIWARCVLGAVFLFLIICIFNEKERIRLFFSCKNKQPVQCSSGLYGRQHILAIFKIKNNRHIPFFVLAGSLIGLHWVSYFYALQYANVALAHISVFTFPVMTTLLEPLILKTRFNWFNFFAGVVVFTGVVIMVPEFSFSNSSTIGIMFGIFAAFVFALRNIFNKQYIGIYSGMILMFYQLLVIVVLFVPVIFYTDFGSIQNHEIGAVFILGLFTTAIGHTMFTHSFKYFTVSTASIINSLTPIYGIIIAFWWLGEIPAANTMIGGAIILGTVMLENAKSYAGKK